MGTKISLLSEVTTLDPDDVLAVVINTATTPANRKVKVSNLVQPVFLNVKDYDAVGDAKQVTDGAMSSGTSTLTSATAVFTSADVGKVIDISGAGASASDTQGVTARHNKVGTITGYNSATSVTVSFTASATVSGKTVTWGTDDSAAVLAALAAKGSSLGRIHFPAGKYIVNSQVALTSGVSITGDGQGVSILYWVGPTRNSGAGTILFNIADGLHDVTVGNLSILGTNATAIGVTTAGGLYYGVKVGTGAGGAIKNLTFENLEIGYVWGMGLRSDGDSGDQAGSAATVINIRIIDSSIHHSADNGCNLNTGGGLMISGCDLTDNGKGGIEFAGSRLQVTGSYVARNLNVGIAPGGLGNPSLGKDIVVYGNLIERNGSAGSGAGIQVGGNVVHALIVNNIVRENELAGIALSDGNPDFASLSRDIRVASNQVISNGAVFPASGITVAINDAVIEDNDVFDDLVAGYAQYYGILCKVDGVRLINNRVRNNTGFDYEFVENTNSLLARSDTTGTIQQIDGNGYSGTVDTSSSTATWKSGDFFNTRWVGVPIKINSVLYTITAVAAAPTGNFTSSGLTITRTSGPNFDTAWVGAYIKLGNFYFPISAVGGASSLTITNSIGNAVPASGTWTLNGSVSLTSSASLGTQTGVGYVIPPHVISPGEVTTSLVAVGSPVSLTTATPANVTSLVLNAGDWDVEGNVNYTAAAATQTAAIGGINTTSATLPTDGSEVYSGLQSTLISEKDSITLPRKRVVVTTTTTVYLIAQATFAAGTVGAFGMLSVRRR